MEGVLNRGWLFDRLRLFHECLAYCVAELKRNRIVETVGKSSNCNIVASQSISLQ